MHSSGITCDDTIKDQFNAAATDENILFLKVEIENENFIKTGEGKKADSVAGNWEAAKAELKPKSPCYILMKHGSKNKWLLMYYVPDNSHVKKKMLIASSYAELKNGLGTTKFLGEYPISAPEECSGEAYALASGKDNDDVMTFQEREEKETAYEENMAMSEVTVSAVVGVQIPLSKNATDALETFQAGDVDTIIFELDSQKEILNASETGTFNIETIASKLPEREPRYVLHNYRHERDGKTQNKNVFIYYCPDKSKPKQRMFYSTGKSNVLSSIEEHKIPEPKRLEISLGTECTEQAVLDELYPKSSVKKVFKKPTRKGKGRAKFHGSKFQAR